MYCALCSVADAVVCKSCLLALRAAHGVPLMHVTSCQHFRASGTDCCLDKEESWASSTLAEVLQEPMDSRCFLCSVSSQDGANPTTTSLPSRKVSFSSPSASQTIRKETQRVTRPSCASSFHSSKGVQNCIGHSMADITSHSMWGPANHG